MLVPAVGFSQDAVGTSAPKGGDSEPESAPKGEIETTDEYELVLVDGRVIVGKLVETHDDHIIFAVGGVPTRFSKTSVSAIKNLPPIDVRYKQLRSAIDDNDGPGLMRLADWLRSRKQYEYAVTEIDAALKADPGNPEARQLRILIIEEQKIAASAKNKSKPQGDPAVQKPKPAPKPVEEKVKPTEEPSEKVHEADQDGKKAGANAFPLLDEAQINVIRVYEVDLSNPPKMVISKEALERFMTKFAGSRIEGGESIPTSDAGRQMYARKKPAEILNDMFTLRARDFYPEVKVLENPKSLQLFRDNVNRTWLVNSCATSRCHGGEAAGRLYLYDKRPTSDAAAITNFFILDKFRMTGEDGKAIGLIDFNEPANSPLLQMGLPRAEARFKHPEIEGKVRWKPVFRSTEDERFQQAVDWIKALYPKRVEYPIDYTPPKPPPPLNQAKDEDAAPAQEAKSGEEGAGGDSTTTPAPKREPQPR